MILAAFILKYFCCKAQGKENGKGKVTPPSLTTLNLFLNLKLNKIHCKFPWKIL